MKTKRKTEMKRMEEKQFVLNFTKNKNIIEKQMFRGKTIKE